MLRKYCVVIPIVAVLLLASSPAFALGLVDDKIHEGLVVSASAGKIVMTDKEGKNEHTHMVAAGTKVTLDGKDAKLEDLKKGDGVKVTADPEGKVVAIAATRVAR